MENLELKIVSGACLIRPQSKGSCIISSHPYPYFESKLCKIACINPKNPSRELDVKIGTVINNGFPQLPSNIVDPNHKSPGLHPEDIEYVNWSVFGGFDRKLEMVLYNPHEHPVAVFVSIEGFEIDGRAHEDDFPKWLQPKVAHWNKIRNGLIAKWLESRKEGVDKFWGWEQVSSNEITLNPDDRNFLHFYAESCAYFEPKEIRFYGYRTSDSEPVPFLIGEVINGARLLHGSVDAETFVRKRESKKEDDVGDGSVELQGVLTSNFAERDGWRDISSWPKFSIRGLGRELKIVVCNPWDFPIRVRATIRGQSSSHGFTFPEE